MMVLIDNYDSFTWNLYQVLASLGVDVRVVRNDAATVEEIVSWRPQRLMVSPGPGSPDRAGISVDAIRHFAGRIPVLGVCLGHQALVHAFGGEVVRAERIMHGKTSPVRHDGRTLFTGLPDPFDATRYHSLIARRAALPGDFEVSAETDEGEVMAVRHLPSGAEGVQFHPESVLCTAGPKLLETFATC